jgi:hypothetical protein
VAHEPTYAREQAHYVLLGMARIIDLRHQKVSSRSGTTIQSLAPFLTVTFSVARVSSHHLMFVIFELMVSHDSGRR